MSRKRKYFSGEEKVALLKRHLVGHEAVSDICDQAGVRPNVFYRWQKEFFETVLQRFAAIAARARRRSRPRCPSWKKSSSRKTVYLPS